MIVILNLDRLQCQGHPGLYSGSLSKKDRKEKREGEGRPIMRDHVIRILWMLVMEEEIATPRA